jgi:hypothetical protein
MRRADEALTAATALALLVASPTVAPYSLEGVVVEARMADDEPQEPPEDEDPCPPNGCGGNHNESVARDRC